MYGGAKKMISSSSGSAMWVTLFIGIELLHGTDSLDFSQSDLTEVPIPPTDQAIDSINLDKNKISELFPYSFNSYYKLTKISIASNNLQRIHDGTFNDIANLGYINLNFNNIIQLPANFGPSTTTLYGIDLIAAFADDLTFLVYPYFSAFTGLGFINIGLNNIGNLNDSFYPPNVRNIFANTGTMDTFPTLSSLTTDVEKLSIADHQITVIPTESIAGLVELKEVSLYGNKIRNFPNFSHCVKLSVLRFERNQLSYIPREHIEGLQSIREIHFTNNLFIDMPDISHLISLQQFLIGYNLITEIPASFIEGLMNMKTFACNNNKLKSLSDISVFSPELEELYVQGNYLKTLPDLFEFPSLATLQAAENPYECNMSMCWLRMLPWLKPSMNILTDNPICDLPPAAADTRVVRFHPTLMKCYNGGSKI